MSAVEYDGVTVEIDGTSIIRDASLMVDSGEFLGVIGPNGSGKSTLLRCVYRALAPSSGGVRIDGHDVRAVSMRENARRVAALTQSASLDFDFTAAEVVATGRLPHRELGAAARARDREVCAAAMATAGVEMFADRVFTTLSGGEAQRVLIARAFAQEPNVLILDEPTNHLDIRHQFDILGAARGRGVTVVAALHDLNMAAQYCTTLAVVLDGTIACIGPPDELLTAANIAEWYGVGAYVVTHPRTGVPQIIFDDQVPQAISEEEHS
ncbi:ABC transporter ATP-binding protein [Gordonia sp. w5E2]|uniref:ABC transporter ATP-binding protein n=1 Tax=Gordonia jacobaea TaxID=122202 RepID=A0ABR5IAT8_9ACTN|nr:MULTISPECIES: ABC transporter ATP-binding protein [Gordonia]KNA90728.1 ABC transporter ATP-binding protein [Gordonia jacobaea]